MNYKKIIFTPLFLAAFSFMPINPSAAIVAPLTATTVIEIQTQIQQLQEQIAKLQKQLEEIQDVAVAQSHNFDINLKYGDSGGEVNALWDILEKEGFDAGDTPTVFGEMMVSAVAGFQEKYKKEILTPLGLEYGTGFVGPSTRAKLNALSERKVIISVSVPPVAPAVPAVPVPVVTIPVVVPVAPVSGGGGGGVGSGSPSSGYSSPGLNNDHSSDTAVPTPATPSIGSLDISLNPSSPAGATTPGSNKELLRVDFQTKDEDVKVNYLKVCAFKPGVDPVKGVAPATEMEISKLRLYESANLGSIMAEDYFAAVLSGCAVFNNLNWVVGNATLVVKGDIIATSTAFYLVIQGKEISAVGITSGKIIIPPNSVTGNTLTVGSGGTNVPSIIIESNPQADSSGNITIKQGDQITITGVPSNLSGQMITDYTRAFFFDSIFDNSCSNTDWTITCTANQIGASNFFIELYKDGQIYQSNVIKVTVVVPMPSITVLSPNGGESWQIGNAYNITWISSAMDKVQIALLDTNLNRCVLNNGILIPETPSIFTFKLTSCVNTSGQTVNINPGNYKIQITGQNESYPYDNSDNYFSIVEAEAPANPYPGFLMTADKPNYVKGDVILLTIQRVDGKDFLYFVDVDAIEINTTPERRFTVHQKLDVSSPEGTTVQIDTSLADPFLNGAGGVYMLVVSAYGEEMIGGVNTNSIIVDYSDIPNPDSQ